MHSSLQGLVGLLFLLLVSAASLPKDDVEVLPSAGEVADAPFETRSVVARHGGHSHGGGDDSGPLALLPGYDACYRPTVGDKKVVKEVSW